MDDYDTPLRRLAADLARSRLHVPVTILLDALSPLDVLSSQLARFSLPFVGGTGVEPYASALSDAAGWRELRRLLDEGEMQK